MVSLMEAIVISDRPDIDNSDVNNNGDMATLNI